MQLDEFFNYKNQIVEDLLTNERIVRMINKDVSLEDAASLMYKQVFPLEYVPDTVQGGATYICCDVDIRQSLDKTFWLPTIYVWVFTHRSKLRMDEGGVLPDALCCEICKEINGSRKYGLGELNLYSVDRFAPMTDYQGKVMTFHAKDVNRFRDGSKPIPSNRKTG